MKIRQLSDDKSLRPSMGIILLPVLIGGTSIIATQAHGVDSENQSTIEEVVSIGSARAKSIEKSTIAVSSMGKDDLGKVSIRANPAEALKAIPGITIETSGNSDFNLMSRGFPQNFSPAGNIYVQIREDGLPVLENPLFVDAQYFSSGPGLARVEGVRGSTAGIWGTNSPGALINFVTKEGGPEFQGEANVTYGFQGLYNFQSNISGPLAGSEDTFYSLSANYIYDEGIREREHWPLNEGGEIFGNILKELDNGSLRISGKVKNKTAHQTRPGIVGFSSDRGYFELPEYDVSEDNFVANDFDRYSIPLEGGGTQTRNMSDGNTVDFYYIGAKLELDLSDKLKSTTQFRYTDGSVSTDIDINLSNDSIEDYANGIAADLAADTWRVEYLFPRTGDSVFGPNYDDINLVGGNGLYAPGVHITWDWENTNWFLTQQLDYVTDRNSLSAQIYLSSFTRERTGSFHNLFHEAAGNPRSLELIMERGGEDIVVSNNGFAQYGTNYTNEDKESLVAALIVEDEFQLNDKIDLSVGVRHEYKDISTDEEGSTPVDLDGNPDTVYDNNFLVGTGEFTLVEDDFSETSWTVASNYQFNDQLGIFLRYSDLFLSTTIDDGVGTKTQDITMFELGFKYYTDKLSLFATLYQADLKGIPDTRFTSDANGNLVEEVTFGGADTAGLELNVSYAFTDSFSVDASLAYLDAEYDGRFVEGPDGESIDVTGNQVIRQPEVNVRVVPSWRINDQFEIYAAAQYFGDRMGNESNTAEFDAYTMVDLGATWFVNDRLYIKGEVINALDEAGQQEGSVQEGNLIGGNVQDVITLGRFTDGISGQITLGFSF